MKSNRVFTVVTAAGLALLPRLSLADTGSVVHMIYHDTQQTFTGKTTSSNTIEDRHVLDNIELNGNKATLVFDTNACQVYESGVQTNKGCNWAEIQGDLKAQSKYSPRVDSARSENALTTSIAFDSPEKAAAFQRLMTSKQSPQMYITAADVTSKKVSGSSLRSPSSANTTSDKVGESIRSSNVLVKMAGSTQFKPLDEYLASNKVSTLTQQVMSGVKMDGGDSEENAAVYTNRVKGNVDSGSTQNPTTPSTDHVGHF